MKGSGVSGCLRAGLGGCPCACALCCSGPGASLCPCGCLGRRGLGDRPEVGRRVSQLDSQSHSLISQRRDRDRLRRRLAHLPAPPSSSCGRSSPSQADWSSPSLVSCESLCAQQSGEPSPVVLSSHGLRVCECVCAQGLSLGFRVVSQRSGRGSACPSHRSLRRDAAAPPARGSDAGIPQLGVQPRVEFPGKAQG